MSDLDYLNDAIHGRVKTRRPYRLKADELAAYNEAVICGWAVIRATKRENLENAYWMYCELTERPFVRVRPRRAFASVSFDFIAIRKHLTERGADAVGEVIRRALTAPDAKRGASGMWGTISGYISDVPVNRAEQIAAEVWACITAPGHWESHP